MPTRLRGNSKSKSATAIHTAELTIMNRSAIRWVEMLGDRATYTVRATVPQGVLTQKGAMRVRSAVAAGCSGALCEWAGWLGWVAGLGPDEFLGDGADLAVGCL